MVGIDVPMQGTAMSGQFSMCGWPYDYSVVSSVQVETNDSVESQETGVSDCFIGSPGRIRTADQRINSLKLNVLALLVASSFSL
jgi:hypothetical protein